MPQANALEQFIQRPESKPSQSPMVRVSSETYEKVSKLAESLDIPRGKAVEALIGFYVENTK